LKVKLFHENAVGGMVTDSQVRVLKNGQPIPGLFACGDNCSGIMLSGAIGVQYIEGVVSALTFAFNSGYLSGTRVSDYTK
jgi:predicted oxidoreductase